MKIYDLNDESNYFFIINKGSVNLVKNIKLNENNRENYIENNETKMYIVRIEKKVLKA